VAALRDAMKAVALAESADRTGDRAAVGRRLDEVARLVRIADSSLDSADADPGVVSATRTMREAANYLEFMVNDFRASGTLDPRSPSSPRATSVGLRRVRVGHH